MLWKKLFYIFPITLISGAIFLGLAVPQPVFGSPGLSGELSTDKLNTKPGEEFTITISGSTDSPKIMRGLAIEEKSGDKTNTYRFNCVTGNEEMFNNNSKPESEFDGGKYWKTDCQNTWHFTKTDSGIYKFKGWVYDSALKSPLYPLNVVTEPASLNINVESTPEAPLSGEDICTGLYTDGIQEKSAHSWCGTLTKTYDSFTFCNGNDSIYFKCSGFPNPKCLKETAKQTFNDFENCPRPDAPVLIKPINGQEAAINSDLLWERVKKPKGGEIEGYKWEIFERTEGPSGEEVAGKIIKSGLAMGGQTISAALPAVKIGEYYFWTARAITTDGRESLNGKTADGEFGFFKATKAAAAFPTQTIECQDGLQTSWPKTPLGTPLDCNLTALVRYIYEWGISLGGFAAFIVLVMAGFQYLTSAGDPGKMKEAMNRIRDAVIGLGLLLASVLILNTINPQLTELKEPPLQKQEDKNWGEEFNFDFITKVEPCSKVKLFAGVNNTTPREEIYQPPSLIPSKGWELDFNQELEINSVSAEGGCQITLFQLDGQRMNADYPSVPISSDVKDIGGTYGINEFRSIRIKSIQ